MQAHELTPGVQVHSVYQGKLQTLVFVEPRPGDAGPDGKPRSFRFTVVDGDCGTALLYNFELETWHLTVKAAWEQFSVSTQAMLDGVHATQRSVESQIKTLREFLHVAQCELWRLNNPETT